MSRAFTSCIHRSDYQEAIRAFASSIQLDPTNARTYLNRGMSYERINNMQQAIADYSKAIELVPKDAKAYYIRGVLFWRLGKDMEALSDIGISAELDYRQAKDFLRRKTPPTNEQPPAKNRLISNGVQAVIPEMEMSIIIALRRYFGGKINECDRYCRHMDY